MEVKRAGESKRGEGREIGVLPWAGCKVAEQKALKLRTGRLQRARALIAAAGGVGANKARWACPMPGHRHKAIPNKKSVEGVW